MRISNSFYLIMAVVLLVGLLPLAAVAEPAAEIEQALRDQLAEGPADFFVKMALEADTGAATGMDWEARGRYVWDALNQMASATQGPVLDYCAKNGVECTPMLINNSVFVRGGSLDAAQGLAALPGVAYLRLERVFPLEPIEGGVGLDGFVTKGENPEAIVDWGLTDTGATEVWATGVRGAGIKVANIDTGVQWDHPALQANFACASGSDPACWADPSSKCGGTACDWNGHGTHTMGTMAARDDPGLTYTVGMAPDATWIACMGCDDAPGCSEYALTSCADWILAPAGDPGNRPNVVNNSWSGGPGEPWYLSYVNNWRNAGIFPAFSAGNDGPTCGTVDSPSDYQESFATAAHAEGRAIASFSGRGPAVYGHDPYTKPNISAPGAAICSTVPTNGWNCTYGGTSMSSPHTAGAVALLWSACPDLVGTMEPTWSFLQDYADAAPAGDCGAPPDGDGNYTYGYGYLNILASVTACSGGVDLGTLEGYVYDQLNNPIEGASIFARAVGKGSGTEATTDPSGYYSMPLLAGTYDVTASKRGYTSQTVAGVAIAANGTTVQNFSIDYLGFGNLQGHVHDQYGAPVEGVFVEASDFTNATTGPDGFYSMELVAGTYDVTASKLNYTPQTVTGVVIVDGQTSTQSFLLQFQGAWTQIALPGGCPDWTRLDGEYSVATGLVYLMGGRPGTPTDGSIYSFDPATQTCADTGVDMVVPISNYTIVPLYDGTADVLCTFGGRDSAGGYSTAVQCYDPAANTVAQVGTLPGELGSFIPGGANVVDNVAYVFGGFRNTTAPYHTTETWAWDPVANAWTQVGDLTLGRGYIDNAVVDGMIYTFGGDTYDGAGLVAQTIAEVFDPTTGLWDDAAVADLPTASGEGRAIGFDSNTEYELAGKIAIAGGGQWSGAWEEVEAYDVASDAYDYDFVNLNTLRRDHAGFFVPGNPGVMWVFGGYAGSDSQPFGVPEYYEVPKRYSLSLPLVLRNAP